MRPVPVPISNSSRGSARGDDLDEGRLDLAFVDIERANAVPLDGILAEIGAGEIGALALDGGEALQVESDRRVGLVARGDELARQDPRRHRPG